MMTNTTFSKRFQEISTFFIFNTPYLYEFISRMNIIPYDEITTIGVGFKNNQISLYYNENFTTTLSKVEFMSSIFHEIMHIITLSHYRGRNLNLELFNIATDVCINEIIKTTIFAGIELKMPENSFDLSAPEMKGYTGKLIAEDVYEFLLESGNTPQNDNFDSHMFICNQSDQLDSESKELLSKIAKDAQGKSYGSLSKSIVNYIKDITHSRMEWERIIKNALDDYSYNQTEYKTWNRLSRRNPYIKGIQKISKDIIIAVDVSFSVYKYKQMLNYFFAEVDKMSEDFNISLITFDTKIKNTYDYQYGDWRNVEIDGGGGTEPQCVFDYVEKNNNTQLIIISDGEFNTSVINNYFIEPMWVIFNNDSFEIPFGKIINISKYVKEN